MFEASRISSAGVENYVSILERHDTSHMLTSIYRIEGVVSTKGWYMRFALYSVSLFELIINTSLLVQ